LNRRLQIFPSFLASGSSSARRAAVLKACASIIVLFVYSKIGDDEDPVRLPGVVLDACCINGLLAEEEVPLLIPFVLGVPAGEAGAKTSLC
jgi:hypothetical protein